jgi:hypothetical protein
MTNQTNKNQKRKRQQIEYGPDFLEGAEKMNEVTQPEAEEQQETPKPELLVLKTGYGPHASLSLQPARAHRTLFRKTNNVHMGNIL